MHLLILLQILNNISENQKHQFICIHQMAPLRKNYLSHYLVLAIFFVLRRCVIITHIHIHMHARKYAHTHTHTQFLHNQLIFAELLQVRPVLKSKLLWIVVAELSQFTCWMPFLLQNQQCQSIEANWIWIWNSPTSHHLTQQTLHVFYTPTLSTAPRAYGSIWSSYAQQQ